MISKLEKVVRARERWWFNVRNFILIVKALKEHLAVAHHRQTALDVSSRDKRKFVQNVVKSIEKQTRKKRAVELPLQDRTAEHLNRDIRSESRQASSGGSGAREDGGED
jgi:hypothetical protein